ncbi:MAG: hypothetical protein ACFNVM_04165, partial [Neisseria elongata]
RQRCREIWNDLFDGEYSGIDDAAAYETIETESNDPFNNWNGKKPSADRANRSKRRAGIAETAQFIRRIHTK